MTQPQPDGPRGARVLVVDDSSHLRRRVCQALDRAGLTVVGEAADGEQALAKAAEQRPDVVLMDLRMPKMDGIRATRALHERQPGTPVLLWTGDGDASIVAAARAAGARAGVAKGIRIADLVATLLQICAAH